MAIPIKLQNAGFKLFFRSLECRHSPSKAHAKGPINTPKTPPKIPRIAQIPDPHIPRFEPQNFLVERTGKN